MPTRAILLLVLVSLAPFCFAQAEKIPVVVEHTGRDSVGQRLVFELREVIRGSQSMRLVTPSEAGPRIVVHVATVEGISSSPGTSTAASISIAYDSVSILFSGYFVGSSVQTCGSLRTQECARDMAASIDAAIQRIRTDSPSLWKLLK